MSLDIFKGVSKAMAPLIAKGIKKEDFLIQLKEAWSPVVSRNSDIESEVPRAMERIKKSGFDVVFRTIGITDEDIRQVLLDIQESKSEPIRVDYVPGRNEPCNCGSGLKYKKCCNRLDKL